MLDAQTPMSLNPATLFTLCRLQGGDASCVLAHFVRLSAADRSQRFWGALVTDDTIAGYVGALRFADDLVFGLRDGNAVIGVAHGARYVEQGTPALEVAFSVDQGWRGLGLGKRLMRAVLDAAAQAGVREVVGMCTARNLRMRRVFEGADMLLTREDDEWHARRPLVCQHDAPPMVGHAARVSRMNAGW